MLGPADPGTMLGRNRRMLGPADPEIDACSGQQTPELTHEPADPEIDACSGQPIPEDACSGQPIPELTHARASRPGMLGPADPGIDAVELSRDTHLTHLTPTFTHRACSLGGWPEGVEFVTSFARGAGPRRERSDRSGAAPRTETSAGAGRRVRCRVAPGISRSPMHPCHASPGVGRSSAAGTRRRSPRTLQAVAPAADPMDVM